MKLIKRFAFLLVCALIMFSCAPRPHAHGKHRVPPGQVKKVTGSKSARPYAPGQLKKDNHKDHRKEQSKGVRKSKNR